MYKDTSKLLLHKVIIRTLLFPDYAIVEFIANFAT